MCSNSWNFSYLNETNVTTEHTSDFCSIVMEIEGYMMTYLLHIMLIPVIILIIITILGKENEDAKWFAFHTALLNLILGIISLVYFYFSTNVYDSLLVVLDCSLTLSVNSIFPLAFVKCLFLYFPNFYTQIFTKKTLIPLFLCYDLLMVALYFGDQLTPFVSLVGNFVILVSTILCSSLIFLKIRKMMHMVDHKSKQSSYSDLKRAAFICIFQTCLISLHLVITFYTSLYYAVIYNWVSYSDAALYWDIYVVLYELRYPVYQLFVVIDTCMTLFILRSYRNALKKSFIWFMDFVKYVITGKKVTRVTTITIVKSVNHFTKK